MNLHAKPLAIVALVLRLSLCPASAQTPTAAETSGWTVYKDTTIGFQARVPAGWRVSTASGTGAPTVSFDETASPGQARRSVQFWVQRNANPTRLPITDWYAQQVRATTSRPPDVTVTSLGERPALRREVPASGSRRISYFAALNPTDVFQVTITHPASEQELDATRQAILSSVGFLR